MKEGSEHTPGKWTVKLESGSMPYVIETSMDRSWIAAAASRVDAEFIASAPQLLEERQVLADRVIAMDKIIKQNHNESQRLWESDQKEKAQLLERIKTLEEELSEYKTWNSITNNTIKGVQKHNQDLIVKLETLEQNTNQWISVKKEPPSYTVEEYFEQASGNPIKIFVTDGKDTWISYKSGDGIMFEAMNPTVTHWQPLPKFSPKTPDK